MDFHFSEQSNLLFSVHQHKVLLCFGIVCGLSSLLTKLNTWACVWVTEIPITEGSIKEGCFTTRFLNSSPLMQPCKIRYTHTSATNEQIWVLLKVLFLSLRLLWNLKNNELFKRVQLWHINTLKSLFYLTKRGVFLPKGKQTFPHKISPCVSCAVWTWTDSFRNTVSLDRRSAFSNKTHWSYTPVGSETIDIFNLTFHLCFNIFFN